MRRGGGKAKGSQYEREVCVQLSRWVSSGVQEDVFWRSALSGGRATVAFKKGKSHAAQVGDISAVDPLGNKFIKDFAVEIKFYKDLNFQGLLTGKGHLIDFWTEINEQASRYNKHPIMFVRQNRLQPYVCLGIDGRRKLGLWDRQMTLISPPHNLRLMTSDTFFKECKPYV